MRDRREPVGVQPWQLDLLRQRRGVARGPQGAGAGAVLVSMLGYTVAYSTLDNNGTRPAGLYAEFKQDFAGVGGDVNFIRSTVEARTYYEMFSDVVGVLHLQGGHIAGWGGNELRMLDHFQMGRTWFAALRRPASARAT